MKTQIEDPALPPVLRGQSLTFHSVHTLGDERDVFLTSADSRPFLQARVEIRQNKSRRSLAFRSEFRIQDMLEGCGWPACTRTEINKCEGVGVLDVLANKIGSYTCWRGLAERRDVQIPDPS